MRVGAGSEEEREALEALSALITDELNVKSLVVQPSLGDLTSYTVKPNFKALGLNMSTYFGLHQNNYSQLSSTIGFAAIAQRALRSAAFAAGLAIGRVGGPSLYLRPIIVIGLTASRADSVRYDAV